MLLALKSVDYVIVFHARTPARLIEALKPQVLVKGADWAGRDIVGGSSVRAHGGRVARVRLAPGQSTTAIIKRIVKRYAR